MRRPTSWGDGETCPRGGRRCNARNPRNVVPHCVGQWAVQLMQCTGTPPRGSGQCNSCKKLPHCLGAVGSATSTVHCLPACGQWGVELVLCTTTMSGGSGLWNSCNARPQPLGAVGSRTPFMHSHTIGDSGQCNSCTALPHRLWAAGSGAPTLHRHTVWMQWAVELLLRSALLPRGSGQWNSCHAPPRCLGAVGGATPAMHCLTA